MPKADAIPRQARRILSIRRAIASVSLVPMTSAAFALTASGALPMAMPRPTPVSMSTSLKLSPKATMSAESTPRSAAQETRRLPLLRPALGRHALVLAFGPRG